MYGMHIIDLINKGDLPFSVVINGNTGGVERRIFIPCDLNDMMDQLTELLKQLEEK